MEGQVDWAKTNTAEDGEQVALARYEGNGLEHTRAWTSTRISWRFFSRENKYQHPPLHEHAVEENMSSYTANFLLF